MAKYFLTKNAGRAVVAEGKTFTFAPVEYFLPSGSWWGTFLAEDKTDAAILSAAAQRGEISEISEEDFNLYEVKKKKAPNYSNSVNLKSKSQPTNVAFSGKPAEVVDEPVTHDPAPQRTVESLEEVLAPKADPAPKRKAK